MFASNFIVNDSALKHIRGQDKLTKWSQNKTIATGNTMTNYFCSVCGTLMYRVSSGEYLCSRVAVESVLTRTIRLPREEHHKDWDGR